MALRLAFSRAPGAPEEPASSLQKETESDAFRALLPAILDESHAPDFAVLTRFTGSRMLRGKIARDGEVWRWHFVLDTEARHEGTSGLASSYEHAKQELVQALAGYHVGVRTRTDDHSLHEPLRALIREDPE